MRFFTAKIRQYVHCMYSGAEIERERRADRGWRKRLKEIAKGFAGWQVVLHPCLWFPGANLIKGSRWVHGGATI